MADGYIVCVVLRDLTGMNGPVTIHATAGAPALAVLGMCPVYGSRAEAVEDWPGCVIVPVTFPDLPESDCNTTPPE